MGERMLDWDTVTGDRLMSAGWAGECLIELRWRCWMAGRQLDERTVVVQDGRVLDWDRVAFLDGRERVG